ncbi:putative disease resistance protein RGA3 [Mangifera indica]|uniref:putative disease resistance protein RGA3 n=1 Tax=Mangifera indica TaxID=29780 RepID=UPI001CFAD6B0|nr:putative disease resistance protein RGA3 [Mangifera indica]XP_044496624.1 putative disease resistance protein RGA3 [Mangifera indica]XP_044496625.1 putative disease resistance protein RGA3 [Mangifera indica]XP_044496626.1 putative disease resistance protein RGA3 [Mangifera indica]XP_044496627.1 putative disease resistance protein RGA3 [Mangifera indica]XP_044496628.1 putative disease resistance protein RGA3 [Mangifera indica]XP_044496629.1 putative disease resistance protein RGA3 [Mangifer
MAEAIVSFVLKQLGSILSEQASGFIKKQVTLVGDVEEEVDKLTRHLRAIQAVLFDAEQKQMKEEAVRVWLHRLKDACYDVEDVLDEWNTAILKLRIEGGHDHNALAPKKKVCCFFPSPCLGFKEVVLRRDIAVKITDINKKLDVIAKEKSDYNLNVIMATERSDNQQMQTTSFIDVSDIIGRDNLKNDLVSKLLCEGSEQNLHIISLVGMGGIGKTALAQFAYNNNEVMKTIDKRIWVCVSDPFDEFRVAKAIIESLEGHTPNVAELESLLQCICDSIKNKKFLLILDDVWTENYKKWEPFYHCLKNGSHRSKILITTRKESVARMMNSNDIINVGELSYDENWLLFRKLALSERSPHEYENLEEIGKKIVCKCKGLPLATKTIGSLLRLKKSKDQWEHVLGSELWKLENVEKGLLTPLMLSYNDLPPMVKQCFIYCSIFPKDYEHKSKDRLIDFWMAQGYLGLEKNDENEEIIGKEYCDYLLTRSLLQENKSWSLSYKMHDSLQENKSWSLSYKMHDIVHDFAQFLGNNECLSVEVHGVEDPLTNSSHDKVRHLMLTLNGVGASFPESTYRLKWLRSLLFTCHTFDTESLTSDVLARLFTELTCLRLLKLKAKFNFEEIPKEIGKLIHLRYLQLHDQRRDHKIKLPESLCELYNLHTFELWKCLVETLPQGIENLVNLRRLDFPTFFRTLLYMPKGVEKLTGLRRLSEFVIPGGGDHDNKACSFEGLENLNRLEGRLKVRGLGNLTDVSDGKLTNVFKNKEKLDRLDLEFYKSEEEERLGEDDELILKTLQLPPNLENLWISRYRGNTVPSTNWMTLTKLKVLRLERCSNCKHLHHLGNLPFLEMLRLIEMSSVKKVDDDFWGIESETSSTSSLCVHFPKLTEFNFWNTREWEEWDCKVEEFMPCLASLIIVRCPKLKALPDRLLQRTTLKQLVFIESPILTERYNKETGEDWPKISHVPSIGIDG